MNIMKGTEYMFWIPTFLEIDQCKVSAFGVVCWFSYFSNCAVLQHWLVISARASAPDEKQK